VVAIGAPEGLQNTVTSGIVSYLNRKVSVQSGQHRPVRLVQQQRHDGQLQRDPDRRGDQPGNSGGPLINAAGEVIGIKLGDVLTDLERQQPGGSVGLGFAIPINRRSRSSRSSKPRHSSYAGEAAGRHILKSRRCYGRGGPPAVEGTDRPGPPAGGLSRAHLGSAPPAFSCR